MKNSAEIAHGPMFIGFAFNVLLYGIMITQVYLYLTTYKKDKNWMKFFVLILLLADTINTIFNFVYLYRSLIVHFGNPIFLSRADWLFATSPALTGIIASLVQLFFARRIHVLTRSWALSCLVTTCAVAGGVSGVLSAYEVARTPLFVDFQNFKAVVIIWLVSESLGDIMITTILKKHKTGFYKSDMMVDRIIRLTVQTGFITSLVAILDLVFYLCDSTGTHLLFNFPLCKLYTNSLMSSLNARRGWKYGSSPSTSTAMGGKDVSIIDTEGAAGLVVSDSVGKGSPAVAPSVGLGISVTQPLSLNKNAGRPMGNKHISPPKVYVHVESHELHDFNTCNNNPSLDLSSEIRDSHDTGSINSKHQECVDL